MQVEIGIVGIQVTQAVLQAIGDLKLKKFKHRSRRTARQAAENFPAGRVKIMKICEATPKIEKKRWISRGLKKKSEKFQGIYGKIAQKSRGPI